MIKKRDFKANGHTVKIEIFTWIADKQAHGCTGTYLVDIKVLDDCQKAGFLRWISIEIHCSMLCLNRMTFSIESDQSLMATAWGVRAMMHPGPEIFWDGQAALDKTKKDHRARKHSLFLPLSRTADRRLNKKQPIEDEKGGKMRVLPPFSELFPCTGLAVGGLGHYSVLFGFITAYQFSSNSLIVGE